MDIDELKTRNDLSVEEIELLMKNEKELKVYKKLSYLRFRALGYTKKESFHAALIKKSTGYTIEDKYAEHGYNGLLDKKKKKGTGRKLKLNTKQLKELSNILKSENNLTIHKIKEIIKNKWSIEYTYTGVKKLLINHFKVDITDYLDYNPKAPTKKIPDTDDLQNFNNDEELKLLISKIHEEKEVFIYRKLLSLIFQRIGFSLDVISIIIGITDETLLKWNEQWNTNGYDSLSKQKGQGRTPKLSDDEWEKIRKLLSERNDWTLPEIASIIKDNYGVTYSQAHLAKLLKKKLKMHFAKPYGKDYRQSPYYKQSFHLKLMHIFNKYDLRYDYKTGNVINMETNELVHFYSFDEASFQFSPNNVKFWALFRPIIERDTTIFDCKVMGSYGLLPYSKDYIEFVENKKSKTLIAYLENLRNINPIGVIFLLIDNFSAHKTDEVFEKAEELNIELCFLPTYSQQLQPIEKVWKDIKRLIALFKIYSVKDYKDLTKKERKAFLQEIIEDYFYDVVKSKNKWNKVFNNFILPKIKSTSPEFNQDWEVQKV